MAHGTPDWGLVGPKSTTYGLDDLGEHAVRLGSPHFSDRRGDALFLTDFSEGLGAMEGGFVGVAGGITLETEHSRQGAYAVGLTPGTGLLGEAWLRLYANRPAVALLGVEFTFSVHAEISTVQVELRYYTGARHAWPRVRIDMATNQLDYHDIVPAWQTFATGLQLNRIPQAMHTIKMVVNPLTHHYERVICNDVEYDLRAYQYWNVASGVFAYTEPTARVVGDEDHNPTIYVDNFIYTLNEPSWAG